MFFMKFLIIEEIVETTNNVKNEMEEQVPFDANWNDIDLSSDPSDEILKKKLLENIPMARIGDGKDIAKSVIFLASDMSNYITGETIHVNGGMYMS